MNIFQSIILGLIQGLTEFIPISSSGHLVLIREIFGFKDQGLAFDVFLHLATLLAVLIYFRKDWIIILKNATKKSGLFLQIIIATIPAFIIGFCFSDLVEDFFRSVIWTSVFLILTGIYFIIVERIAHQPSFQLDKQTKDIKWHDSLLIGIAQAIAILPGVSRSGATIATGMLRKLKRTESARFSFLLSTIAILGAGFFSSIKIYMDGNSINGTLTEIILGALAAFIAGYFSIKFLMKFLQKHGLIPFAIYIILLGSVILIYSIL